VTSSSLRINSRPQTCRGLPGSRIVSSTVSMLTPSSPNPHPILTSSSPHPATGTNGHVFPLTPTTPLSDPVQQLARHAYPLRSTDIDTLDPHSRRHCGIPSTSIFDRSRTHPFPCNFIRKSNDRYMAAVSWMDHQLGRIMDELDTLGLTR